MKTKQCSKCKDVKSVVDFFKQLDGLRSQCKSCMKPYLDSYKKSGNGKLIQRKSEKKYKASDKHWTPSTLFTRAKASAKQHGRNFFLTKEEYIALIDEPCYYCQGLLNNEKSRGIGLDRVDNSKGYELNNVIRCCGFCNKTKGDRLSVEEMKKVAMFLIDIRNPTNNVI